MAGRSAAVALAALSLVAAGCGSDEGSGEPEPGSRGADTVAGPVAAMVNGTPISSSEVISVAEETGLGARDALVRLEEERVLVELASARFGDDREAEQAARRAAVQAFLAARIEVIDRDDLDPAAVRARAAAERGRFRRPERRRSTHVLVTPSQGQPDVERAALALAREALAAIRDAPDPVAAAHAFAAAHQDTGATVRAEDLPAASRNARLVPEYLEALFSAPAPEPGTSGTVLPELLITRFGFHAIVLTEVLPPWEAPEEEVMDTVERELVVELRARRLEELLAERMASTEIVRNEAVIERALGADFDRAGAPTGVTP